jgi:predicted methyltransferase
MIRSRLSTTVVSLLALIGIAGCAVPRPTLDQDALARAVVAQPDRSEADRQTDLRRHPVELLVFAAIQSGMKVLDLGTGGGYSTELLARAVGPEGVVYGQDAASVNERAAAAFGRRMTSPSMSRVVRLLRDFDDPLPPGTPALDRITVFNVYHDLPFRPVDRVRMNQRLFDALKPGGLLVVTDHSAVAGAGIETGRTLHRIDEGLVRRELEAAGFRFVASADFLRHPEDARTARIAPALPVDEFVLKFVRP